MDKEKRVAADLRKCADILRGFADELSPEAVADTSASPAEKTEAQPTKEKPITLEAVRAVAAKIARAGGTEQVKALIEKHGADKLSAVPSEQYGALLKELEGIGDGR